MLLLPIFAGIVFISFSSMAHGSADHGDCVFSQNNQAPCPQDVLAYITFHVDAFRSFSLGVLDADSLGLLFAVFVSTSLFSFVFLQHRFNFPAISLIRYATIPLISRSEAEFLDWFGLHQHSPSFV